MKDNKNIDRLFQEKFRDFEQTPPPKVWDNISAAMYGKPKKDRRVFALWFSGVAAGLAILFSINNPFVTTNIKNQNSTDTNDVTIDINSNPETELSNTSTKKISTTPNFNPTQLEKSTEISKTTTPQKINKIVKNNNSKTSNTYIANKENSNNVIAKDNSSNELKQAQKLLAESDKLLPDETKKTINSALVKNPSQSEKSLLADNTITNEQTTNQSLKSLGNTNAHSDKIASNSSSNKWILSTLAAPILLNAFDNNSSIDSQFNNNEKQGQLSAAFGVQLAYQLTDRLILQSGLHIIDYGYKTLDVFVSPDRYASVYSNISYDEGVNLIDINPIPSSDDDPGSQETGIEDAKGNLTQVFGYYEIPLEAKYSIKKGNFGINVLGGFSTLILNKNEIYVQTDDFSNKIGEASNLNNVNLTGNLGVELDYKLYQNIRFNVTPMIKVHANTFEKDTGGFNPYAIGVYSGLNFRF